MGVQHAHVCVFGVDNDECLICGTRAALVGQQSSAQRQPGPSWKKAIYEISEQVPTSKRDWSHKPHFSRLICICVGCLVLMILLVAVTAVALSIDANECSEGGLPTVFQATAARLAPPLPAMRANILASHARRARLLPGRVLHKPRRCVHMRLQQGLHRDRAPVQRR